MIVWVLFIWMGVGTPPIAAYTFTDLEECKEFQQNYTRSTCVQVPVPYVKKKSTQ